MGEPAVLEAQGIPAGLRPVSPAGHLAERFAAATVTGDRGVSLREVPWVTMVGLRVQPGSDPAGRIENELGLRLPAGSGQIATTGRRHVLWLSPDEFLLIAPDGADTLVTALRAALADDPGAVVDLSANRTTLELAGRSARAVLEKGCALDLHPRVCRPGTAYLTAVGSVPVILWKLTDEAFRLLPRSSFADFLGRWLIDAMREFQGTEMP